MRGNWLVEPEHFTRAPLTDEKSKPLRRPARSDAAARIADLSNRDVIGSHSEVACQVKLIPAADDHTIQESDRRLANPAQFVVRVLERAEPFPIIVWARQKFFLLLQIRAGAERLIARAGEHEHGHAVIIRRILKRT